VTISERTIAALLHEFVGLAFPEEKDVALAATGERVGRAACAGIQDRGGVVDAFHEIARGAVAAERPTRVAPRGEVIPLAAAGGARIGCDDLHAVGDEIVPVADVLGITLVDDEDDRGGVRRAVVRQARLPIGGEQRGFLRELVDDTRTLEADDVGLGAVLDGARLRLGAAVRTGDGELVSG
jgi:hypothetical protein